MGPSMGPSMNHWGVDFIDERNLAIRLKDGSDMSECQVWPFQPRPSRSGPPVCVTLHLWMPVLSVRLVQNEYVGSNRFSIIARDASSTEEPLDLAYDSYMPDWVLEEAACSEPELVLFLGRHDDLRAIMIHRSEDFAERYPAFVVITSSRRSVLELATYQYIKLK